MLTVRAAICYTPFAMTEEEKESLTPCEVCQYRQTRSKCFLCPHEKPMTWEELGCGCLALIGLFFLFALVARLFA